LEPKYIIVFEIIMQVFKLFQFKNQHNFFQFFLNNDFNYN